MSVIRSLDDVYHQIVVDPMNVDMYKKGYAPVYTASERSRVILVGQAPGRRAQETMKPWNDASGKLLREWLGVTDEEFYDTEYFALMPMDFYYPGKGSHGDLPPRSDFASTWHPLLRAYMPDVKLVILIGAYAQKYYLGARAKQTLTETTRAYQEYLPDFFPLVHPSPLNFRWRTRNPWFETEIVPALRAYVASILHKHE